MAKYVANPALRGFFAGAGKDTVGTAAAAKEMVALTGKPASEVCVLYIGTPTYDIKRARDAQVEGLAKMGCKITALELTDAAPLASELESGVRAANILVVSGGNTLWALDRWRAVGLPRLLRDAMHRGTVLAGGSAGAICWFDGGHSDSMDPHTYLETPYLFTGDSGNEAGDRPNWKYIRVPGLGFLPGLVCPHHDKVQSNGVARSVDFDGMLARNPGEQAICIDHNAALIVEGSRYKVFSIPGEAGSVMPDGTLNRERAGKPGVWTKRWSTAANKVEIKLLPVEGELADILVEAESIIEDPEVRLARRQNPQRSSLPRLLPMTAPGGGALGSRSGAADFLRALQTLICCFSASEVKAIPLDADPDLKQ